MARELSSPQKRLKYQKLSFHSLWSKTLFLFDLDGTLYLGDRPLDRAQDLIALLRSHGKRVCFFTNNSSRSDVDYVRKLKAMGFGCQSQEVVMSTHSLVSFLKAKSFGRSFVLGTKKMKKMLRQQGIAIEPAAKRAQVIVVGFDKELTYERLKQACFAISAGLPYVVTHPDWFCPTEQGPEPDCGALALLIEQTTGKKPLEVLGKPSIWMIRELKSRFRFKPKDAVLIGDRLSTDILMANQAGIDSVLVLSGDSSRSDLGRKGSPKPSFVIKDVAQLCASFEKIAAE